MRDDVAQTIILDLVAAQTRTAELEASIEAIKRWAQAQYSEADDDYERALQTLHMESRFLALGTFKTIRPLISYLVEGKPL